MSPLSPPPDLAGVLHVGGETVLVLPEVLQGCVGVGPPDVQHQLDPAVQDCTAACSTALPPHTGESQ